MELKSFDFWNSQLIPWITHVAIGTYIGPGKESEHMQVSSYVPIGTRVYIGFWPWVGPGGVTIYLHRPILTYM